MKGGSRRRVWRTSYLSVAEIVFRLFEHSPEAQVEKTEVLMKADRGLAKVLTRVGSTNALFAWFLIACLAHASAEPRKTYFVVNGHGTKTSKEFALPASVSVYTPSDLSQAYSYEDDNADPKGIEKIFAAGQLPAYARPLEHVSWQQYTLRLRGKMPDVLLTPLNFDTNLSAEETGVTRELKYLKENISHRPQHWAYDTGADSILFIRRANAVERIVGHRAVKQYMDAYDVPPAKYTEIDAPIILVVPRQNKVKVLGRTSISEVTALLNGVFLKQALAQIGVLLAACNEEASPSDRRIVLSTDAARATPIPSLFPN